MYVVRGIAGRLADVNAVMVGASRTAHKNTLSCCSVQLIIALPHHES